MNRREFIAGIGLTAAWSPGARTQSAIPVIGFMNNGMPRGNEELQAAFRRGVGETGFIEGQNARSTDLSVGDDTAVPKVLPSGRISSSDPM